MKSRSEIDTELVHHPAVFSEPRQRKFRHFHPNRLRFQGVGMEARVAAKALLRSDRPQPFLIYSRPRSGSTLLVQLMDQVPNTRCDGELLNTRVLSPRRVLKQLPRRAGAGVRAYGLKLLSYQLMEIHRVLRPIAFFDALGDFGYRIIHLRRDSYEQTLSLAKAHATRTYFVSEGETRQEVRIDPERFLDLLAWNVRMLDYETQVMAQVPHMLIDYETDLREADRHQATIERLCNYLQIAPPAFEVKTTLRRTGGQTGAVRLANGPELEAAVRNSPLAHVLS